uniref:Decaprenyl-diphosphate synthase subunit 2 n=1 Tax=Ciona savignyi TaxID=51511 RepID=H2YX85_CIOSA
MNCNDIYSSQRSLAELTELIHTAFLVHRGLIDVDILVKIDEKNLRSEMELGNKMAVLSGDFLLANACVALSELKHSKVVEMMSSAIEDLSHGFFVLPESGDSPHISLDDLPTSRVQWEDLIFLAQGSLVANACAAAVELANQTTEFGKSALNFGKHFMLAQQARLDIERLCHRNIENNNGHFNHSCSEICSLPVVLLAQLYGGSNWLNSFIKTDDITNTKIVMKDELQSIVSQHPSVLEESEEICRRHHDLALSMLNLLPPGEPTESLKLLTKAVSGS